MLAKITVDGFSSSVLGGGITEEGLGSSIVLEGKITGEGVPEFEKKIQKKPQNSCFPSVSSFFRRSFLGHSESFYVLLGWEVLKSDFLSPCCQEDGPQRRESVTGIFPVSLIPTSWRKDARKEPDISPEEGEEELEG